MPHRRPRRVINLAKQQFGELKALKPTGRSARRVVQWLCQCSCGERLIVEGDRLRSGQKKTCGRNNHFPKKTCRPGFRKSYASEYRLWANLKQRCLNPAAPGYRNYGKIGITLDRKWARSFEDFMLGVGPRPTGKHFLARIDENGSYVPGNAEWRLLPVAKQTTIAKQG